MYRGRLWFQKLYRFFGKPGWYLKLFPLAEVKEREGERWLEYQGPTMYELIPYLKNNADNYAAFIFFTYLYYPTAVGIQVVGHKSLFIPTMHDEPPAYFPIFRKVMAAPQRILFNTESEKRFSEKLFSIDHVSSDVVAVGIDPVDEQIDTSVPVKFGIKGKYILYVGRIDTAKGCKELLQFFLQFAGKNAGTLTLVLAGKNMIEPVKNPAVIYAGFVSDEDKEQLIKQAEAVVIPSKYESLSLVLLESFACRIPVVVNADCEVLADHIHASNGGWGYKDYNTFGSILNELLNGKEKTEKGKAGYDYVMKNYSWEEVLEKFDQALEYVEQKNAPGDIK